METFNQVAIEWFNNESGIWEDKSKKRIWRDLHSSDMSKCMAACLDAISLRFVLDILREIENRGAPTRAKTILMLINRVMKYAQITGRVESIPSLVLYGALKKRKTRHYTSLKINELPEFLKAVDRQGELQTRRAIYLLMLTFVRTNELINARWTDINWDTKMLEIPAERMKMRRSHLVPLSDWAISILREQQSECGDSVYLFPGIGKSGHMSNNTVLMAIYRAGYADKMTGHGFRSLAMTTIKEKLGYRHEVVDRQLAHSHNATYDRSEFIEQRIEMMNAWSDYLSGLV